MKSLGSRKYSTTELSEGFSQSVTEALFLRYETNFVTSVVNKNREAINNPLHDNKVSSGQRFYV